MSGIRDLRLEVGRQEGQAIGKVAQVVDEASDDLDASARIDRHAFPPCRFIFDGRARGVKRRRVRRRPLGLQDERGGGCQETGPYLGLKREITFTSPVIASIPSPMLARMALTIT